MTAKQVISRETLLPVGLALTLVAGAYAMGNRQAGSLAEDAALRERVKGIEKRIDDLQARQDKADERFVSIKDDLGKIKERLGIVEASHPATPGH
jgi:chromosome segregation ATPase